MTQTLDELLKDFPPSQNVTAASVLEAREAAGDEIVYVVLDDDPTGTQSVANLPVLTAWEPSDFEWAFGTGKAAVYVMTNSRSLTPADAERINREVVRAASQAAQSMGVTISFVSRSDSTMRGHFPLEPLTISDELAQATGSGVDGIIVVPAFGDAGRITISGTHYAGSPTDGFVPVGETEFAKDATFGYSASYLPEWVEEKSSGDIPADSVTVLDLTTLRTDHDGAVTLLRGVHDAGVVVVDIVDESDLRLLALALIEAEKAGSRFIYRVGPPFPRARIGQDEHPPLTEADVEAARGDREFARGGLVVVGSHVALTTRQLENLRADQDPREIEIVVSKVIDDEQRDAHIAEVAEQAAAALDDGNVVVSTSRELVRTESADESLAISRQVSAAVVAVVQKIIAANPPRFVIAKGGITSSDTASKGLGMRHAMIIGPMQKGIISLWIGQDGPGAGIPYVVFAGNVGDDQSLATVARRLSVQ